MSLTGEMYLHLSKVFIFKVFDGFNGCEEGCRPGCHNNQERQRISQESGCKIFFCFDRE